MDPNLWIARMTMRVPSYYEVHPVTQMVSDELSMLYTTVNNDDDEVDESDGDDADSSQSESDDDNDLEEGDCEKWQTYTLPYLHVLAVCRKNGSRADTYVPEIYSRQTYRRTYQVNFHPVLSENFWRDVPFNLTFYPPNMKKERGTKQDKRFKGKMDYRNPDSPQDVADVACWDIIEKIIITPDQAMYKFAIFLKLL
ncbi:hypothetical protein M9H77_32273 [Catharanthus roseus]|uniref:Uncharacterized protein n=1 Tax=Catharanthus roseus TaxID=4058 RepID=A0ACC0A3D2_CATRO|nr:hypothetical protein M9H77_32273 [Catharanthus roseus]